MALLNSIAVAANQSEAVQDVLGPSLEEVCKYAGWDVGHAFVSTEDGSGKMESAGRWFTADDDRYETFKEATEHTVPISGQGLVGRVLEQTAPYWIADLTAEPGFTRADAAKQSGLKAGIAFPVKVRDEVFAVLEFFATETIEPSVQLVDILTHVASQIGQVVERQDSKNRLIDQNARFDAALNNMSQGLSMFDDEQRLIVCNRNYATMYGMSLEQITPGITLREIVDCRIANGTYAEQADDNYYKDRMAAVSNGRQTRKIQKLSDGRVIDIYHCPMPDGGWLATHEDVTERLEAQQVIQRQKEELDQILRNAPCAVITTDSSGIISVFNPVAEMMFGYAASEAIGQNVKLLMPERVGREHDGYLRSYLEEGAAQSMRDGPRRLKGRHKDGMEFPLELALSEVGQGENKGFIGVAKDITEELKAEEKLIEHRDTLQNEVELATLELKTKAAELKMALEKEKELNKLQRQFVSMVSHEFRTPLTIIDGAAQFLIRQGENITTEFISSKTEKIRDAVKRMTRLVESTLSAARMEEGNIEVNIGPCDIKKVLSKVCERQQSIANNHTITCAIATLPESIQADSESLEQVFTNLLSNAVKYAPDAPRIEVEASLEGPEVVISVRDQGIGIDEDDLGKIGERFFRAKTSTGIVGTGIGLNLVRKLLELHGGSIGLESKKNEGSTFTVRLPVAGPGTSGQADAQVA